MQSQDSPAQTVPPEQVQTWEGHREATQGARAGGAARFHGKGGWEVGLNLEQKQAIVTEVAGVAARASNAIAAEYAGLTVSELTRLRASARKSGVFVKVVRNTLARRALDGTRFACMSEKLVGPLLLAFAGEEPGSAARVIRDFSRQNNKLVVNLVAVDGRLFDAGALEKLANLPSLQQARSMLLGVFKAPLGKFVRVLSEPGAKFVRVLAAQRDKQQAA
jgi:large subunit ribosomal protein L10